MSLMQLLEEYMSIPPANFITDDEQVLDILEVLGHKEAFLNSGEQARKRKKKKKGPVSWVYEFQHTNKTSGVTSVYFAQGWQGYDDGTDNGYALYVVHAADRYPDLIERVRDRIRQQFEGDVVEVSWFKN